MNNDKPKILFLCGRELNYTRNKVIHLALERVSTLTTIAETGSQGSTTLRSLRICARAAKELATAKYDYIYIGFYGYLIFLFIKLISRTPVIFDPFISNLDTLIYDRKIAGPRSVLAKLAFWLDRSTTSRALVNLLDTHAHIGYFNRQFGVPEAKFCRVFVSCEDDLFYPRPEVEPRDEVLFYGSFLPIHGIDVILHAARIVAARGSRLAFRIIGSGQEHRRITALAAELQLNNVIFQPAIPLAELPPIIARSKICLGGHFGASEKARRVIAGKTYQCIAMGRPTIVGNNPANAELFAHGQDAWFCPMNSPEDLAESILLLDADPQLRKALGEGAYRTFTEKASPRVIREELAELLSRLPRD